MALRRVYQLVEQRFCYLVSSVDSGLPDDKRRYSGFTAASGDVAPQKCTLTFSACQMRSRKIVNVCRLTEKIVMPRERGCLVVTLFLLRLLSWLRLT